MSGHLRRYLSNILEAYLYRSDTAQFLEAVGCTVLQPRRRRSSW
jgi:hypothetical protein